jgi:hypothetical protein
MNFLKYTSTVLAILVAGVACNSSDDSGGSSGVDKSTQLTALTGADLQKVCDYAADAVVMDPAVTCRVLGYSTALMSGALGTETATDASLQAACQTAYDACMKDDGSTTDTSTQECKVPTGTCTATVGELESCYSDLGPAMEAAYSAIPACSEMTVAALSATTESTTSETTVTMPATCNTLASKCPSALSGTSTDTGDTSGETSICTDGTEGVTATDVCDGFEDCADGSDEDGCA